MKTNKLNKKYTPEEQADSFVFRNRLTPAQKLESVKELDRARKALIGEMNESQVLYSKVKQLRYQIEDYAKSDSYNEEFSFAYFLKRYIKLKYKIQKNFAKDIEVSDTELSSILNKGRPPGKKIIIRLELHSNNTIPAISWYKLLEKEKEYELKTDKTLRKQEEKHVQNRLVFDF